MLKLYRVMIDFTARSTAGVSRLIDCVAPIAHIRLAMTATGYCSMLGHFLDSFSVQTCVFLFQSFHPAAHILPRYFLGTTEHFGTVTKSSKHANAIISNQQVV